jgi:hypothetical protein
VSWHYIRPGIAESEDGKHRLVLTRPRGPGGRKQRFWAHAVPDAKGRWKIHPDLGATTYAKAKWVVDHLLGRDGRTTRTLWFQDDPTLERQVILALDGKRRARAAQAVPRTAPELSDALALPVCDVSGALRVIQRYGLVSSSGDQWTLTKTGIALALRIRENARPEPTDMPTEASNPRDDTPSA